MTTGVDLNLQFPAGWENARQIKYSQGFNQPAPRDFVGFGPLTEPEALTIYNFTLMHDFKLVLAYHTQGQEIYWQFQNFNPPNSLEIGQKLAEASGYKLADTPYNSSFAVVYSKLQSSRIHYRSRYWRKSFTNFTI